MREIFHELERRRVSGPFALATVVKTWGSAPRPAGSHMAVLPSGAMIGSVSGGCVETAVVDEALAILDAGAAKRLQYGVSDETAWSVGLACGGRIEIFVQRIDPENSLFRRLRETVLSRGSAICCTSLEPVREGGAAQLLLCENEAVGEIEETIDRQLQARFSVQHPPREAQVVEIGGTEIFVEPLLPPARLIIIGGVHIAIPLSRMAAEADFEVTIVDPRSRFIDRDRFPSGVGIEKRWPDEALEALAPDNNTFVVALSHDPKLDDPALLTALKTPAPYIGVLGSRRTHEKRMQRLRERGMTEKDLARLHAPIGIRIGGRSPAEIAVSILAEMIAVRHGVQL